MAFINLILCPVDFSEGSERAVDYAGQLAQATGSKLELMHVYTLPALALPDGAVMATPEYVTRLTDQAQRGLDRLRDRLAKLDVQTSTYLIEGQTAPAIVSRAETIAASLLVMGTHGRSGFKRFLLGSTTERVLRTSPIPVLTVHLAE